MKKEEIIAKNYFERQGVASLVYEPNGNITPDFCYSQQVAIEVTRLNRSFIANNKYLSEEEIYIPFWNMLKKVIATFDCSDNRRSYLIIVDYVAPCFLSKSNEAEISKGLTKFLELTNIELPYIISIDNGISLRICEFGQKKRHTFYLSAMLFDIPYPITLLYIENIRKCITRKSNKILSNKQNYPFWVLVLVDSMEWNLCNSERENIQASISDLGEFNSLIVIDKNAELLFKK